MSTERKYALSKNAPGDYCLPSNDGQTIWRIARYTDGPSLGLESMTRDREFWGLWRWHGEVAPGEYIDTGSWSRWDMYEGLLNSRADAIKAALKASS